MIRRLASPLKRIRLWRWIVAGLFGVLAGYPVWTTASRRLGPQPLYEIAWNKPSSAGEVAIAGPWLFTADRDRFGLPPEHYEVRTLRDGLVRHTVPYDPAIPISSIQTLAVVDHPTLGPDTILQAWQTETVMRIGYLQPLTHARELLAEYPHKTPFGRNAQFTASGDGRRILQRHWMPLSPFLLLGTQGLPDVLAADFHSLVTSKSTSLGVNHVTLIRVRDSRTWELLGSFSLANTTGSTDHYVLTWDGRELLRSSHGMADSIEEYFTRYPPATPALRDQLQGETYAFRLIDSATGRVVWQADQQGLFLPNRRHPEYFHVISAQLQDGPSLIAGWNIMFKQRWILLPRQRRLVELPFHNDDMPARERVLGQPRLVRTIRDRQGEETLSSEVTVTEYDLNGQPTASIRMHFKGSAGGEPFHGSNQFFSLSVHVPAWYKSWHELVERWPWLRWIPYRATYSVRLIDADHGDIYTLASVMQPEHLDWNVSQDEKYFLVMHYDRNYAVKSLKVYELPFPRLPFWRRNGAMVLGWGVGLGVGVLVLLVRRRKKQQPKMGATEIPLPVLGPIRDRTVKCQACVPRRCGTPLLRANCQLPVMSHGDSARRFF